MAPARHLPRVRFGEVFHDMLGMPTPEVFCSAPPWVSFGCTLTYRDRHCGDCGHEWCLPENDDPEGEDPGGDDPDGDDPESEEY